MAYSARESWLGRHLLELLLTAVAALILLWLGGKLDATAAFPHLALRYSDLANSSASRALFLNTTAGTYLTLLAIFGWCALFVGRLPISITARLALTAAIWILASDIVKPFAINGLWPAAMILSSVAAITLRWNRNKILNATQNIDAVWRYPVFVLLTGIGLLWLTDYSARAYSKFQYIALLHADALFWAYVALSLCAQAHQHLMAALSRILSQRHGEAIAWVVLSLWCVGIGAISEFGVLGKWFTSVTGVKLLPALTTELIRAPLFVAAGWVVYRWVGTRERAGRGLAQLAWCSLLWITGQALAHDHGPVLVFAASSGIVLGGLTGWALARYLGSAAVIPALAVTGGATWCLHTTLITFGPRLSGTLALRIAALEDNALAKSHFLSELRWFMASTPTTGHGLGTTPWCGDWAWLTSCTQGLHAGVPQQMQSDYVFAALYGVFGPAAALLITALLIGWLVALVAYRREFTNAAAPISSLSRLRDSIVAVFAVVTLMQLAITVFGTLGVIPLTGVAFPLAGFGRAALILTSAFAALAFNRESR